MPTIPASLVRPALKALDAVDDALAALEEDGGARRFRRARADLYEARHQAIMNGEEVQVTEEVADLCRTAFDMASTICLRARAMETVRAWPQHLRRLEDALASQQEAPETSEEMAERLAEERRDAEREERAA